MQSGTDERRIDKARVIRGQDHRPGQRDIFRIVNAPPKIGRVDEPEKRPADEVTRVHFATAPSFLRTVSMMILLVSSGVWWELLIAIAPRATPSGAAERWLSR